MKLALLMNFTLNYRNDHTVKGLSKFEINSSVIYLVFGDSKVRI